MPTIRKDKAESFMAELKSQINNLVKLQTIDTEIYALQEEKESKPKEIEALRVAFEEKKEHLLNLEKKSQELQVKRKEHEGELASKEENAKKLQSQLYSLKTNKEYQTMLEEINNNKADSSVIEDKILLLFEEADKGKNEIEQEKQRLKEEEKGFNESKSRVEIRIKEIDDRLAQLEAQRKQALVGIEARVLTQYERILQNRDGLAIVMVKDDSCKGCNMSVPPQVVNLIKMYERIITCEICNRILYIDEGD
ncbi:MAG: C4-type zinc ribbon domain-containing protein [Candidatus Omnitrophota bacterium]